MTRRRRHLTAKPKPCAFCGAPLPVSKPVVLIEQGDGKLVGPYHFGCAEKLVLAHRGRRVVEQSRFDHAVGYGYTVREETLPW